MKWALDEEKSKYIFRYYIPCDPTYDEETFARRAESLIQYCLDNSIDTVMLYVDLDPNWYYMPDTVEHTREYINLLKPFIPRLRENGISYQLNYQNLFGSWDGGADLSYINGWECWVDEEGIASGGCACSAGIRFREIAGQKLAMWAQTAPDAIWIDDDIRFHNHRAPIRDFWEGKTHRERRDYGCFCDNHIRMFNEKYGTSHNRDVIREGIMQGGDIRRMWLEFSAECADDVAAWIEDIVHSHSPETRIAVMTSVPDVHSVEGRNWRTFLGRLSGDHKPLLRPHFGPYVEGDSLDFYGAYLLVDQLKANIRNQYGKNFDFCPEIENTRFTRWSKSVAATEFQIMMSSFHGCRGVTLSVFDLEGCILDEEPEFSGMFKKMKPFADTMAKYDLWNWDSDGVALLTAPDRVGEYKKSVNEIDGLACGRIWDSALAKAGIPVKYITPDYVDEAEAIAVDRYTVHMLRDREIPVLLSKGVLLDAGAAAELCARGYGEYLGVMPSDKIECIAASEIIDVYKRSDLSPVRIPSRIDGYKWNNLILTGAVKLSTLVTPYGSEHVGFCRYTNTLGGRIYIYAADGSLGDGFYSNYRVKLLKEICKVMSDNTLIEINNSSYALAASKKSGKKRSVMVANMRADVMEDVEITVPEIPLKAAFMTGDGKSFPVVIDGHKVVCKGAKLHMYDALVCMIQI